MGRRNVSEGEYLAFLSEKHSVDPNMLFQSLVSAKKDERIICGNLSIELRGWSGAGKIFLMMEDSRVVAQVRISEVFLAEKTNPISKFKNCERIRRFRVKKDALSFKLQDIGDLHVGMIGVNLTAQVLEVKETNIINTRSGNQGIVANALIGDKTGTVQLSLWNDQVGSVAVGDTVQIFNAKMFAFRGVKQLRIGRCGTLKVDREQSITA